MSGRPAGPAAPGSTREDALAALTKFPRSKQAIRYDAALCTGCGQCELMCALFNEGEGGPRHARIRIARNAFEAEYSAEVCAQCVAPSCYAVCPYPGEALRIDEQTGVRYVDPEHCTGCGICVAACPLEPPRIGLHGGRQVAFKCDLCRDHDEGPQCVRYCPEGALSVGKPMRRVVKAQRATPTQRRT
jgi:Fe-S-cluster-containing dehydrogenase component